MIYRFKIRLFKLLKTELHGQEAWMKKQIIQKQRPQMHFS